MKKKTQRILVIVLAAALLLTILVPALTVLAGAEVTEDDIADIKGELSDIVNLKNQVQKELNAVRGDLTKAKEQITWIQAQITLTEQEIDVSQRLLEQYDLQIQHKVEEINGLEEEEAQQYEEFYEHVRWLEETGSVSYLSILFKASSFSELLDYAMLIADIMEYSNRIIKDLEATQAELREAHADLELSREEQAMAQKNLETQKATLEESRAEAEKLYDEIKDTESELAAEAKKLAETEKEIERELKKAEEQYAAQIAALKASNEWYWPLPGIYYISSVFGGRYHPITGKWHNHGGTDIPAAGGTKIYAAQDGVVTTVSKNKNSSYGWYCIITHANGRATLYAHMRSKAVVKEGQTVSKGALVGYVGTTGSSTGNHLHFELRINGEKSNVLLLYPDLPYTGPWVSTIKKMFK